MSEHHPTTPAEPVKPTKPSKPYPDFPLFPHAAGVWAKKIRGRLYYFGPWSDLDGALQTYLAQKDDLHAGRTPKPADAGAVTVKDVCNSFLNHKRDRRDAGKLSPRTWDEYKAACDLVVSRFGKGRLAEDLGPDDFAALWKYMAKKWGTYRLGNTIQYIRCLFHYAYKQELISKPVRFGAGFTRPSMKEKRLHRAGQDKKLFTAEEVRRLIDAAGVPVKAMLLLGINAGMGNSDCGRLPLSAVDLDKAIIDFPRPKTGVARRCPLWPETVAALRESLAKRPEPKNAEDAGKFFVTKYGLSWAKDTPDGPLSKEMAKLLKALGINGRKGLGFYALRHTFRTIADEAKDQPAADYIMGHEIPHMSAVYRETISDARLRAVTDHVRAWLFPSASMLATASDLDAGPTSTV
jgi:integrase